MEDEGGFDEDDEQPQPAVSGASQPGASSPPPDATGAASAHGPWKMACTTHLIHNCAMIVATCIIAACQLWSGSLHETQGEAAALALQ